MDEERRRAVATAYCLLKPFSHLASPRLARNPLLSRRGILLLALKITLPLALLKHSLSYLYVFLGDWYRGRYMRLTYTNLERTYYRHYEGDYVVRSFCRTVVQVLVLLFSAEIVTMVIGDNGIGLGVTSKVRDGAKRQQY